MNTVPQEQRLDETRPVASQDRVRLERPPKKNPRRWVHATGSAESRHAMAVFYLKEFKHKVAFKWDRPSELTLARVVCNLRHYFLQSREMTVRLIQDFFNPRSHHVWSDEAIGLTWDLVAPYTPSMGLRDPTALNRERAADLYDLVVDFILTLEPGGRVLTADLYTVFLDMHPHLDPVPTEVAFGIAVGDVSGITSRSSKGRRYYSGFHLPKVRQVPEAA